jgi:hypothetical protein
VFFNFDDDVTLVREGQELGLKAYVQSADAVYAEFAADVEEGDAFKSPAIPGDYYVKSIKRIRGPRGDHDGMNHCCIRLATKKEWNRLHESPGKVSQTFNIGSAAAVAGRDVVGASSYNVTSVRQIFTELERRIAEDPDIPDEEKTTTVSKIRDFVLTPRIAEFLGAILKGWTA